MDVNMHYWILIPAMASLIMLVLGAFSFVTDKIHRWGAFAISLVLFVSIASLWPQVTDGVIEFHSRTTLSGQYNFNFDLHVDGLSYFMVLLTALLTPLVILGSASVTKKVRTYHALLLFMEAGLIGTFLAADMALFYICFEAVLIPMVLLVAIFGGEDKAYASTKLFIYTMAGSLPMLVGLLYLCSHAVAGEWVFAFSTLIEAAQAEGVFLGDAQAWVFLAVGLGFAIKAPMFPFHTWLPDAHVQAPTGGSVILAGVMLKMGTYGLLRFCLPLFGESMFEYQTALMVLATIGIIHGSLMCMAQDDMKRLIAYSSVAHLGTVLLGIFALNSTGITGGAFQAINHGLSTGALFFLVGFLYERGHTKKISEYGGLAATMPRYTLMFVMATLASVGMPGTNGFIGEFLILKGAFEVSPWYAVLGGLGVILSAVYMLTLCLNILFGPSKFPGTEKPKDLGFIETAVLAILIGLCFYLGFRPGDTLKTMEPSLEGISNTLVLAHDGGKQ